MRQGASPKRKVGEPLGSKSRYVYRFSHHLDVIALTREDNLTHRSRLSKLSLFQLHLETHKSLSPSSAPSTYFGTKHGTEASNLGEKYQELKQCAREGPFKGWLISGEKWESFDGEGRVIGSGDKSA